jgi:hypothetical protein
MISRVLRHRFSIASTRLSIGAAIRPVALLLGMMMVVGGGLQADDWPMAGHDPQRTSRNPDTVRAGKFRWRAGFHEMVHTYCQPVAKDGLVYLGTVNGNLRALEVDTGTVKWVHETGSAIGNAAAVGDGIVVTATYHGKVLGLDAKTGQAKWEFDAVSDGGLFPLSSAFETAPLIAEGKVFLGSRNGHFYALDLQTGNLAWKYRAGGPVLFSAAYGHGKVFFAAEDFRAYALDAKEGKEVWKTEPLTRVEGFWRYWPVVVGKVVAYRPLWRRYDTYAAAETENARAIPNLLRNDAKGKMLAQQWKDRKITDPVIFNEEVRKLLPEMQNLYLFDCDSGQELPAPMVIKVGGVDGNPTPPVADPTRNHLYLNNLNIGKFFLAFDFNVIPRTHLFRYDLGRQTMEFTGMADVAVDETGAFSMSGDLVYGSHHCGMPLASYRSSENPETQGTAVDVPKDFERPYLFANESNGPGRCPCVISGNRIFVVSNSYLICVEGK